MIEASGLSFSYPHQQRAVLRQLNFSVRRGEIFGFLGPSGAGKSTTQKNFRWKGLGKTRISQICFIRIRSKRFIRWRLRWSKSLST